MTTDATIYTITDLLPLFRAPREDGEVVTIEVWAGVEDVVREQLLDDCEGQTDPDTYLFSGVDGEGDDTIWKLYISDVFGSTP